MPATWLVIGLGNPGPQYVHTRHNAGQLVVDELARDTTWRSHKAGAQVAERWLRPGASKLVLAKPNSFMNVSGDSAARLVHFYDLPPDRVIVVHDELDIPFGALKLKRGGGHGGHNGVRDIARALGTADFARVRVGIGRPAGRQDPADWVLSPFAVSERAERDVLIAEAAEAVELIAELGLTLAQQRVHASRN